MKAIKRKLMATLLAATLVLGMSMTTQAAPSGPWDIDYIPGAPSSISNQLSIIVVDYYSGGYYANCNDISGANGRALTISSSSANGMDPVPITTIGKTGVWEMNGSTTGTVSFMVMADGNYQCVSTGIISISSL